jgi:hypothetical protein
MVFESGDLAPEAVCAKFARTEDEYPGHAPCPACFESSGHPVRIVPASWTDPSYAEPDYGRVCEECNGTGTVDSPLVTLDDLENEAAEQNANPA